MRLANQHKAYVAVLGVALSALAVDHFLLKDDSLGPAQAQASPGGDGAPGAPVAPGAAPIAAVVAPPTAPAMPEKPRLASRLRTLRDSHEALESPALFGADAQWLRPPEKAAPAPIEAVVNPEPVAPTVPFQITSVLAAGDRSCVIIEGKAVRIGGAVGDFTLHSVEVGTATEAGTAVFEHHGELVRVTVKVR